MKNRIAIKGDASGSVDRDIKAFRGRNDIPILDRRRTDFCFWPESVTKRRGDPLGEWLPSKGNETDENPPFLIGEK